MTVTAKASPRSAAPLKPGREDTSAMSIKDSDTEMVDGEAGKSNDEDSGMSVDEKPRVDGHAFNEDSDEEDELKDREAGEVDDGGDDDDGDEKDEDYSGAQQSSSSRRVHTRQYTAAERAQASAHPAVDSAAPPPEAGGDREVSRQPGPDIVPVAYGE